MNLKKYLIISSLLVLLIKQNQAHISKQPILTFKIISESNIQDQIKDGLYQLKLAEYVEIASVGCKNELNCNSIEMIDSHGQLKEVVKLPTSWIRLKELLIARLLEEKMSIRMQKRGSTNIEFLQGQVEQLKKAQKIGQNDDWERANLLNRSKAAPLKINKTNPPKEQKSQKNQQKFLSNKDEKLRHEEKPKQIADLYYWYGVYILLGAGVIVGMKYMNKYESGFDQNKEVQVKSHHEEMDNLSTSLD